MFWWFSSLQVNRNFTAILCKLSEITKVGYKRIWVQKITETLRLIMMNVCHFRCKVCQGITKAHLVFSLTLNVLNEKVKHSLHYTRPVQREMAINETKANTNLFLSSLEHWQFAKHLWWPHSLCKAPTSFFLVFFFTSNDNWPLIEEGIVTGSVFSMALGSVGAPWAPCHTADLPGKKRSNQVWRNPRNSLSCIKKTFVEQ